MSVLGTFVLEVRKQRGLSQRQIVGVSHTQISMIECGQRGVSPDMLRVLARALQVSVEQLEFFASLDDDHDGVAQSGWIRKLDTLKAQGQWETVLHTAQYILRTQMPQLGPVLYARLEKIVAEAIAYQSEAQQESLWIPFATPEEGFTRHLQWYAAGMPPALSLQYVTYLRNTVAVSHPLYGKILNNGMILCEQLGNLADAMLWGQQKSAWAMTYRDRPRYEETQALLLRYFILTQDPRRHQQARICQAFMDHHDNAYAWEDYYLAKMWQAWVEGQDMQARILDREALRHYRPEWLDMPPWRRLYQLAWHWRHTEDPSGLQQWVENWLQWSWDRWDTATLLHYMQIVVQIGLMTQHPQTPRWWHWLMAALRLTRRTTWLEYYTAVGDRLGLPSGYGLVTPLANKALQIPDWMQRMMDYWIDQVEMSPWRDKEFTVPGPDGSVIRTEWESWREE